MSDLTRFNFYALRFMHSDDVRAMNASEVGQYLLLLCESWLAGKEASLPDDKKVLARMARVPKLSPRILAKFPLVSTESGRRRRNDTLYQEWVQTLERLEIAAQKRKNFTLKRAAASRENGKLGGRPKNPSEEPSGLLAD